MNSILTEQSVRRRMRVVTLLSSAGEAGFTTMSGRWLHAVAYLSNALSPLWESVPLVTEMLKIDGAPYDAELQREVDALVGLGMLNMSEIEFHEDSEGSGRWRMTASYSLQEELSSNLLNGIRRYPDEERAHDLIAEICMSLAGLPSEVADQMLALDATYGDPRVSEFSLLRLYDASGTNETSRVASSFAQYFPKGTSLGSVDEIHMYLSHLQRVANA